jgi:predicted HD phosphohydrolase
VSGTTATSHGVGTCNSSSTAPNGSCSPSSVDIIDDTFDGLATTGELLAILARGTEAHDEPRFDVLSHSLQCGDILWREHPDDPELAVAGLVHDIADALTPGDHTDHERRGAELVAPLLGSRVAKLVGSHVLAKRYLVTTEASYRRTLSVRSVETLAQQGDTLEAEQLARLAQDPDFDTILTLRRADERAKIPGAIVPTLDAWVPRLDQITGGGRSAPARPRRRRAARARP